MIRLVNSQRFLPLLIALLVCSPASLVHAQQTGNTGGNNTGGTNTGGTNSGTTAGESGSASDISLTRPELTTDIESLSAEMQSGFVGTSDINTEFLGVNAAGENATNQANRQFNTRTQSRNVNQGTQTQPLYRTFGPNNTPYRSPHKIAFPVDRSLGRNLDLSVRQNVRILSSRRPQFQGVQFVVSDANTVTLRGTVASDDDLKLAMLYVKMNPGVDRVINELQVSSADPAPQLPSAPATPSAGR